jgi:hypothetical protein
VADLSDSTMLRQDPIALRAADEVADVEVVVASMTVADAVVDEAAVVVAQTVVALVTLRARSRLFKSLASLELDACQHCRTQLLRKLSVDLWVVGFVGCGLLTILLHRSCGL